MAFQVLVQKQGALFLPSFPSSTLKRTNSAAELWVAAVWDRRFTHLWIWLKATWGKADRETASPQAASTAPFTSTLHLHLAWKECKCERGQQTSTLPSKVEHLDLLLQLQYQFCCLCFLHCEVLLQWGKSTVPFQ